MMNRFFHPLCCHFMQEDGSFSSVPEIATDMLVVGSSTCGYRVLGSLNVRLCASGGPTLAPIARPRDLCGKSQCNFRVLLWERKVERCLQTSLYLYINCMKTYILHFAVHVLPSHEAI